MKGDYDSATRFYLEALAIQPRNNTVRMNLAKCYASSQKFNEAKSTYDDVVKSEPKNWEAVLELAKVCVQLKDAEGEKWLVYLQANNPSYHADEVKTLLGTFSTGSEK